MTEHHWDELVSAYERWAEPGSRRFAEAALDRADLAERADVLDVAAGTGALAVAAAGRGHAVHAIDSAQGMVTRLAARLSPLPHCHAEVMDARNLRAEDDLFDAAFSVFGVLYLGADTLKAVSEMVRVVRPGGVVSIVHWAGPVGGGPLFVPLARAINRLDAPEAGRLTFPITSDYLDRREVEQLLVEAGCTAVESALVERPCPMPAADAFVTELDAIVRIMPHYTAAITHHRDRFLEILEDEVGRMETPILGRANIVQGRVV
ncbi:class I SAM-dependent methyltransferase [Catenuloplanes japonicus]|uniref:class I SAM-dependent methyltransferase n=1 Tax=Catenuloplanes japonicus TaxID=33876 RepID=UPI0006893266|nr:class I SAM-dependent methyltransferase [Catenuloplanes japonicus]